MQMSVKGMEITQNWPTAWGLTVQSNYRGLGKLMYQERLKELSLFIEEKEAWDGEYHLQPSNS